MVVSPDVAGVLVIYGRRGYSTLLSLFFYLVGGWRYHQITQRNVIYSNAFDFSIDDHQKLLFLGICLDRFSKYSLICFFIEIRLNPYFTK